MTRCHCLHCITPPHMLKRMLESSNRDIRKAALDTLLATSQMRGERAVRGMFAGLAAPADGRRTIFDCRNSTQLGGAAVGRSENGAKSPDASINRAFEGLGATRDFYRDVLGRNSINDQGMRLDGYVHYGAQYNNAFWDGQKMIFGDGDGGLFTDFTSSLDVIAHELTHGVTEFTCGLEYHNQSGALNESVSDVFGSLVKQWSLNQTAGQADWLIGAEVFTPGVSGDALRSMKAPGTAYDSAELGKDPQPDHMNRFVMLPDSEDGDWGGVHINSGIPNKAFYLVAVGIGGNAWDAPAHIWYEALKASNAATNFQEFADTTFGKADQLYGDGSNEQQAVVDAWREVGIRVAGGVSRRGPGRGAPGKGSGRSAQREDASLTALTTKIEQMATQLAALSKEINQLKSRK